MENTLSLILTELIAKCECVPVGEKFEPLKSPANGGLSTDDSQCFFFFDWACT